MSQLFRQLPPVWKLSALLLLLLLLLFQIPKDLALRDATSRIITATTDGRRDLETRAGGVHL